MEIELKPTESANKVQKRKKIPRIMPGFRHWIAVAKSNGSKQSTVLTTTTTKKKKKIKCQQPIMEKVSNTQRIKGIMKQNKCCRTYACLNINRMACACQIVFLTISHLLRSCLLVYWFRKRISNSRKQQFSYLQYFNYNSGITGLKVDTENHMGM